MYYAPWLNEHPHGSFGRCYVTFPLRILEIRELGGVVYDKYVAKADVAVQPAQGVNEL